jgi:HEAT repeat protein
VLNEEHQGTIEKLIELLQEPSDQLLAADKLIGICMVVRTERKPTTRVAGRSLLGETLEKSLIECLPKVMPLVRRKLAFVLGEVGGRWGDEPEPAVVRVLAGLAREDSSADVRAAAVDALGKLGGPGAVNALRRVAEQDPVRTVRTRALFSWEHLAPPPEQKIYGATSIDEFLEEMAQLDDRDTSTVARELQRKRRLRVRDYAEQLLV